MTGTAFIRALVVDDEPSAREAVTTLISTFTSIEVVGEATDGAMAVAMTRRLKPDLLFLDVQMPGLDGFGVLDELGDDVPRGVVFVTAHDEHAVKAFERHALDYVLKPFGRPRFAAAVSRAIERHSALEALDLHRTLQSMAADRNDRSTAGELSIVGATPSSGVRRLGVRIGTRTVIVDVDEIDWVEADGDYARIHAGKQSYLASQRMHALERLLDPKVFVRVHRSVIVNIARVRELRREADGGGSLFLTTGVSLRVARSRWESLEQMLGLW